MPRKIFTNLSSEEFLRALADGALKKRRIDYCGKVNIQVMSFCDNGQPGNQIKQVRVELELLDQLPAGG